MRVDDVCAWLDKVLETKRIADISMNGLQVEGSASCRLVAFAVDASLAAIEEALRLGAGLLVVHHGLFWGALQPLTGYFGRRVGALLRGGLSLYAAHLPLDLHATLGNNTGVAEAAGFTVSGTFGYERGNPLGCLASAVGGVTVEQLTNRLSEALGGAPDRILAKEAFPERITKIAVVTGGGLRYAIEAQAAGAEAFITGETSHAWYHPVVETGIPTLCFGHYRTEKVGLERLAACLAGELGLKTAFIETATGM